MIAATKKQVRSKNGVKRHPVKKTQPKRKPLSVELEKLRKIANESHAACRRAMRTTLTAARNAGEALFKIRESVGGNWEDWIKHNFDASVQTARKYIKIYQHWDDTFDGVKLSEKEGLTIDRACRVIAGFSDNDGGAEKTSLKENKKKKADAKPKTKTEDRSVTVNFSKELYEKLKHLAASRKLKLADLLLDLVEEAA